MINSVISSDGTVVWSVEWWGEVNSTEEELDDNLFSAYRNWYETQVKEENERDCIPMQVAS